MVSIVTRNRIVAGLGNALLITEAAEKSGTLHTARFALEQGKDILAVPGNITNPYSTDVNNLLKTGAAPVTCVDDILHVLGIEPSTQKVVRTGDNEAEQLLQDLLDQGGSDDNDPIVRSELEVEHVSQTLTMLEITGKIRILAPISGQSAN
jgi:DNA processing protein